MSSQWWSSFMYVTWFWLYVTCVLSSIHPGSQGAPDVRPRPRPDRHSAHVLWTGVHVHRRRPDKQGQDVSNSVCFPSGQLWVGFVCIYKASAYVRAASQNTPVWLVLFFPHVSSAFPHAGVSVVAGYCLYINRVVTAFLHSQADPSKLR